MKIKGKDVKLNIYIIFIVIASLWGLAMSILVPVGQTPDEYSHFSFMLEDFGTNKLFPEDRDEFYVSAGLREVASEKAGFDTDAYLRDGMKTYSHGLFELPLHISPGIIKFLPGAIGFHIGVMLRLPMLICHQLAELAALIYYILICTIALKKMPYKKEVMMFVMLMPMAIQQAGSINPDVMVNTSAFLLTAMIFDFKTREKKVGWKDIVLVMILSLILLIGKMVYLPILLGFLIVPAERFSLPIGKKFELQNFVRKYWVAVVILMLILMAGGLYLTRGNEFVKTLLITMSHPFKFLMLVKTTLGMLRDFYLQTMVGCFGWLDIYASYTFIVFFMVFMLYVMLFASSGDIEKQKSFSLKNRLFLILIVLIMFALIMCSMTIWSFKISGYDLGAGLSEYGEYLKNTSFIQGVQGRYFIPFLPILLISIGEGNEYKSKKIYRGAQIAFYLISMIYTLGLIKLRYWG